MLYHHHGIDMSFSGSYAEYFGDQANIDAIVYLMLANDLVHSLHSEVSPCMQDISRGPAQGVSCSACAKMSARPGIHHRTGVQSPCMMYAVAGDHHCRGCEWHARALSPSPPGWHWI